MDGLLLSLPTFLAQNVEQEMPCSWSWDIVMSNSLEFYAYSVQHESFLRMSEY